MLGEIITKERYPDIYDWLEKSVYVWDIYNAWAKYSSIHADVFRINNGKINASRDIQIFHGKDELDYEFNYVFGQFLYDGCCNIKSLKGCPSMIENSFICSNNASLISLKGSPQHVKYLFRINECENLKSLEGCPKILDSCFEIINIGIENFSNCPEVIKGGFKCRFCNKLTSLKGFPKKVKGTVVLDGDIFPYYGNNKKNKNYIDMWVELLESVTDEIKFEYLSNYRNKHNYFYKEPIIPKEVINKFKIDFLLK